MLKNKQKKEKSKVSQKILVLDKASSLTMGNQGSWKEGRAGQRVWK